MIDTHAHLDDRQFDDDREEVIMRAFEGGVKKIINIGADLEGSRASIELAKKYENICATVGLHPHVFNEQRVINSEQLSEIERLAKNAKVVAIGEIGLDYFFHETIDTEQAMKLKEKQKEGLIFQLELARRENLPVIIHCRGSKENPTDAYDDLYDIIADLKFQDLNFVFHCYGGDLDFTEKLLKNERIFFSFTANITYKTKKKIIGTKADIIESIKIIPLGKIMLETDCPYLAPQEFRGQRNEPLFVKKVVEKVAEIRNMKTEEVERFTDKNAEKFFSIDNSQIEL